jgi:hypothetical protein
MPDINTITKTFQKVQLKNHAIKYAQIIVTTVSSIAISKIRYLRKPVRGEPKRFLYLQRSSIYKSQKIFFYKKHVYNLYFCNYVFYFFIIMLRSYK